MDLDRARRLYGKLLRLYPRGFHGRFGESMEQTFSDLYNERRAAGGGFGFIIWTFIETILGIVREHLAVNASGDVMQSILKTFGVSSLISFLLILPFGIMEVVNRRAYNEDFPVVLFVALWLNMLVIMLILVPILMSLSVVRNRLRRNGEMGDAAPDLRNTLLANPKSAALISVLVLLSPGILPLLDKLGWMSVDRLFNGPNPEVPYLPGLLLSIAFFAFPITSGMIAAAPITRTLRSGGSLFAHRINLIIVVFLVSTIAYGVGSLIIDQWPCFMGVRNCD